MWTMLYWNGHRLADVFMSTDETGRLDDEFEFDANAAGAMDDMITDWMAAPRFTWRPELIELLNDGPPIDADV
ncbi:hypothetical protein R69746_07682 [Paraburkholderia aspalathi]|nr:hypothetical protein R69746_07682 [Paraburkholderia aspalathi]